MAEIMTRIRHQLALVASRRIILRQNEALQRAIQDRDELYSVIAHDLRSPLGSMKMSLDMLVGCVGQEQVGDDMYELLVSTNRTADELFTLLDNLLKWTKTNLGRLNVVKQHFDFLEMVAGVIENMVPLAQMSNIELSLNDGVHKRLSFARAVRFHQNLLHSQENGSAHVVAAHLVLYFFEHGL